MNNHKRLGLLMLKITLIRQGSFIFMYSGKITSYWREKASSGDFSD
ncbi:hypothetical protein HPSD74_0773 [Glaesserella parasuis D74]|nr:hypothetical protein HPSD74_0773 [Glaesserella parasuis D74]